MDELEITINPEYFVSSSTGLPIEVSYLTSPIPSQIPLEDQDLLLSASESVDNGMKSILFGSFML